MISKNELRNGNILWYDTGEGIEIAKIDGQDLAYICENEKDFNNWHSPIPLSPSILEAAGFKFDDSDSQSWSHEATTLNKSKDYPNKYYIVGLNTIQGKVCYIEFLHHLQNWWYVNTLEELTIDTTKLK